MIISHDLFKTDSSATISITRKIADARYTGDCLIYETDECCKEFLDLIQWLVMRIGIHYDAVKKTYVWDLDTYLSDPIINDVCVVADIQDILADPNDFVEGDAGRILYTLIMKEPAIQSDPYFPRYILHILQEADYQCQTFDPNKLN